MIVTVHKTIRTIVLCLSIGMVYLPSFAQKRETSGRYSTLQMQEMKNRAISKMYGPGGTYEKFDPAREVMEKRTASDKTFSNADGSFTTLLGSGPVHYEENGLFHTTSNEVVPYQNGAYSGYTLANVTNKHKTLYGQTGILFLVDGFASGNSIEYRKTAIRFLAADQSLVGELNQQQPVPSLNLESDRNEGNELNNVSYLGVASGVNYEVEQLAYKTKTQYVIGSASFLSQIPSGTAYVGFAESFTFSHPVTVKEAGAKGTKATGFYEGETLLLQISDAWFFDKTPGQPQQAMEVRVQKVSDLEYTVTYLVPAAWLQDPNRTYPLYIDPAITVTPNASTYWTGTTNEDADAVSSDRMKQGFYDCAGCDDEEWASYAKFNTSALPTLACVTAADFYLYQDGWVNGNGNDQLQFDVGWLNLEPVSASWAAIRDGLNNMGERYSRWNVWGGIAACGGCAGGYDFNEGCCGWDYMNSNYDLFRDRLMSTSGQDYMTIGLDNIVGNNDCWNCYSDETNELYFTGWSGSNRPRIEITYTEPPGATLAFGDNVWNVYAFRGGNIDMSGQFAGYYTESNLSYNTTSRWCSDCSPSYASGWVGCSVPVDYHMVVSKRTNFTCGYYRLDIPNHDDDTRVYVNGVQVFEHIAGCCDAHTGIWTGYLSPASTIEVRHLEGVGGSLQSLSLVSLGGAPGNPATFGNGTWNVYGYNAGDALGNSGAWTNNYSGYYTENTLNFVTGTRWGDGVSPSSANAATGSAYTGCVIGNDNHSWSAKRTNITCGVYQIQVVHDDRGQIFINGSSVYNNTTCCVSTNAGTYAISPSDQIEYRVSEGGGGSGASITLTGAITTLNPGSITYSGSLTACGSIDPPAFGNGGDASGGASATVSNGTTTYQWQLNGSDIGSATGATYDPPTITGGGTYTYRRRVTDKCGNVAYTNTYTITITANPGAANNTTSNAAICETGTKPLTGTPAGGSWSVFSGSGSIAGTTYTPVDVVTATGITVRYTIAAVGACAATTSDVTFTVNANPGTASNTTSNAAICETGTKPLTATPAGGVWSVFSGSGSIAGTTYTPVDVATATNITVRYAIAASGACVGSNSDVTFTVDANPGTASNTTSTAAICETGTKPLTATPAGGTWSVFSGSGSIAGTTYTPADVATATNITVRYAIAASGSCPGSNSDATFTVNANPGTASNTTSNAAICETATKPLTATPAGGTWSVFSGSGSIAGTTYTPVDVATATNITVRYAIAASGACVGSNSDVTFTVDANPGTASNTTSTAAICETGTKPLTASPAGGTWSVFSGSGSIAGTTYTPVDVATATNITVRYALAASGACAGSNSDVTFTVDASPGTASNTTSGAAICETGTKPLTATPAGGVWSVFSGSGSIAGTTYTPVDVATATSITVRYALAASGACAGSNSDVTFTVNANPGTASNTTSNTAICETGTKALTATPAGGTWSVFSGSGSIAGTTYTPVDVATATSITVRYALAVSGACAGSNSDVTFTVDANSGTASNTTSTAAICETATQALQGTPAGGTWSVFSGGGSIAGTTYTPANITTAGNVTVRYAFAASGVCPSSSSDRTFTVNPIPEAFTPSLITATPLCFRGNARVDVTGSQTGVSYQLRDNTTNVGSSQAGSGAALPFHTANLTAGNSTYNVLGTTTPGCTLSVAVPAITVTSAPAALAGNSDSRTCYVNGNNAYVEFISANGSILAINPGGQNLGNVTVTEYVNGTPIGVQACGTSPVEQPQFNTATLGRHWTISSTVAPTSNLNVRLYFANSDVTALSAASTANTNGFDNVSTLADMELSKYSGSNENGNFTDNCGNGTVTLHPQIANGVMEMGNIGYAVNAAGYTVHTVSSFSEFWLSGTNNVSPLPIELTAFTATCVEGTVRLDWETASEINNEKFVLERSASLQSWEHVATVPGAGNSNQPLNYSTIDARPLSGLAYYRLTQHDYDGKSETFAPVAVTCYVDTEGNTLLVYPNPATHSFKVSVTLGKATSGKLELTEPGGKLVSQQNVNMVKGDNEFTVDVESLNPGTYVLRFRTTDMNLKPVKVLVIK